MSTSTASEDLPRNLPENVCARPERFGTLEYAARRKIVKAGLTKRATRVTRYEAECMRFCIHDTVRRRGRGCLRSDFHEPSREEMFRCPIDSCWPETLDDRNSKRSIAKRYLRRGRFTFHFTFPTRQGTRGLQYPSLEPMKVLTVRGGPRIGGRCSTS